MSEISFLRFTIKDVDLRAQSTLISSAQLEINFSSSSSLFNSPFTNLCVQVPNLLSDHLVQINLKVSKKSVAACEINLQSLIVKNDFEADIQLKRPVEGLKPFQGKATDFKSRETVGSFKVYIEKEELDTDCSSPEEEIYTFKEHIFSEMMKIAEGFSEVNKRGLKEYGLTDVNLYENEEKIERKLKNLKILLLGVNEKLKVLDVFKDRLNRADDELLEAKLVSKKLSEDLEASNELMNRSKTIFEDATARHTEVIDELKTQITIIKDKERRLQSENESLSGRLDLLKAEYDKVSDELKLFKHMDKLIVDLKAGQKLKDDLNSSLRQENEKIVKDLLNTNSEYQREIDILIDENTEISQKYSTLFKENSALLSEHEKLKETFESKRNEWISVEKIRLCDKEIIEKCRQYEISSKQSKEVLVSVKNDFDKLSAHLTEITKKHQKEILLLHKENKQLKSECLDLKKLSNLQKSSYDSMESEYSALKSQNFLQRDYLKCVQDFQKNAADFKNLLVSYSALESEYGSNLSTSVALCLSSSENHLSLSRCLHEMILVLTEKESEICSLRELVTELQKEKVLYMPIKGDVIDCSLANYINGRMRRLEIPFVRLYHGMYVFGSKKVALRCDSTGIVVRFKGGYYKIEDFINANTEIEAEKIKCDLKIKERNRSVSPEDSKKQEEKFDRRASMMVGSPVLLTDLSFSSIPRSPNKSKAQTLTMRTMNRQNTIR